MIVAVLICWVFFFLHGRHSNKYDRHTSISCDLRNDSVQSPRYCYLHHWTHGQRPRLPVLFPQQAENDVTSGPSPQDILPQAHTWPLSPCFRRLLNGGFLIASWPPRPDSPASLPLPPHASCHHVTAYLRLMITSERVGALASAVLGCVFSAWKDRLAPNRRSANTC